MASEGLPLPRRERGADEDILAGADFLSVFLKSSLQRAYRETTTESPPPPPTIYTWPTTTISPNIIEGNNEEATDTYIRTSRATNYQRSLTLNDNTNHLYKSTENSDNNSYNSNIKETSDSSNDGVILAVRVSSSIGKTLINKENANALNNQETTTIASQNDDRFVASEQHHPSLVAEANKSEFSVDEGEPITQNADLDASEYTRSYPASVHALPRQPNLSFNQQSDYLNGKQPYHQTVIYHNSPRETAHARSVSYSTVIQSVPTEKHERHERHYDEQSNNNNNNLKMENHKMNDTKFYLQSSVAESNHYFVTTKPNTEESTTEKASTERNWEVPEENQYQPKVYAEPEQNYEVDEAVSVNTNGRAHGVQPNQSPDKDPNKKSDQKVGYVVEGRNYRKYRVEERTADGFIVGEYGVVSHDDGSLRGVRYTADGTINPRLIYDALMKFLSL